MKKNRDSSRNLGSLVIFSENFVHGHQIPDRITFDGTAVFAHYNGLYRAHVKGCPL